MLLLLVHLKSYFYKMVSTQFQERLQHFQEKSKALKASSTQYAWGRSFFFVACTVGVVMAADAGSEIALLTFLLVFIAGFTLVLRKHQAVKKALKFNEQLVQINQEELNRLAGNYNDFDPGHEFTAPHHPYHIDLEWLLFAIPAVLVVLIAIATVSYQSMRAALADPIKSLRYE